MHLTKHLYLSLAILSTGIAVGLLIDRPVWTLIAVYWIILTVKNWMEVLFK